MTNFFRLPEVTSWIFDEALPFWATIGQDALGLGFREAVTLQGKPLDPGFKRTRVQARQIYTFCHGAELGWQPEVALAAAKNGVEFLLDHAWLPEGGWARRLGPQGALIDYNLDTYEQAFVLFGFGWYYRLTGDKAILAQAHRTIDTMYARLGNPNGQGFLTEAPNCSELQQNPHMHYLEAMLIWYQATGEARFAEEARKVLSLLRTKKFQVQQGVLLEFFDLDWHPLPGEKGRIVEPGHHFEWVWLLYQCQKILGEQIEDIATALFRFADEHGSDDNGLVYDALTSDGAVLRHDHRTWPQTEALKAYIAMAEFGGHADTGRIAQLTGILLDRYLNTAVRGLWTDHLREDYTVLSETVPASTLYHVFLAFAELQRWNRLYTP